MTKTTPKKITRRITDIKRHTVGYVIGGQDQTVAQTRRMAERGQIAGVRVVGRHVQALKGRKRLSDLPTKFK